MSNSISDSGRGVLYGFAAALIWGAFPVVTRLGVGTDLRPEDVTAIRFAVAGLLLLPVLVRGRSRGRRQAGETEAKGFGANRLGVLGSAILVFGAGAPYMLLVTGGLTMAPVAHFGVIAPSSMLIFAAVGGRLFLGSRMTRAALLGIVLIVLGIAIIGGEGIVESFARGNADVNKTAGSVWLGDLMFVAGGFCWAGYTIASRYWSVDPLHGISIVAVFSMLLFLPPYLFFVFVLNGGGGIAQASMRSIGLQAVYQGFFSGILALLLYTRAVQLMGAARGAVFAALVPGFALLIAVPVLGEIPTVLQILGVLIVTAGMIFALGLYRPR